MKPVKTSGTDIFPNADHIDDIRLAASKMSLIDRRAFQAEMAVKYCAGNARRAEDIFGWSRDAVQLGLHEKRTGVVCLSAQSLFGGGYRLRPVLKAKPQKKSRKPTPSSPTSTPKIRAAKTRAFCA